MGWIDYENAVWTETWQALWERSVQNAASSRRGQRMLRELRTALLDMPNKRLIPGALMVDGEVCPIGAMAWYRLKKGKAIELPASNNPSAMLLSVADMEGFSWRAHQRGIDLQETLRVGAALGFVPCLAWTLVDLVDWHANVFPPPTPEWLYQRVLKWVNEHIKEEQ